MLRSAAVLGLVASLGLVPACRRSPAVRARRDVPAAGSGTRDAICYQQPDGCVWCVARERELPILEAEQSRPTVCDPHDPDTCVEFCNAITADCALSWVNVPPCVYFDSDHFYQALFNREAVDHPDAAFSGRVVDDAGHRVEGALVRVWVSWRNRLTDVLEQASGREGLFRLHLKAGPWSYVIRISHPGLASQIVDHALADRVERSGVVAPPRTFRLPPEHFIRGRVTDAATGEAVAGATVEAMRTSDDAVVTGEARAGEDGSFAVGGLEPRRYVLRVSKVGWRLLTLKNPVAAPATHVAIKLERATLIKGTVKDTSGELVANAVVAAMLAGAPSSAALPFTWTTDSHGTFAQEFRPGTYYLWARQGDMLLYPPQKVELGRSQEIDVSLTLNQKAARVLGHVQAGDKYVLGPDSRVLLLSPSPLAFPRAATGEIRPDGAFAIAGVLPGRYEISVRDGARALRIEQGPSDVEVPIEPNTTINLREPVVVRPPIAGE